uniref:Uncharacterized protein n=1 Tax=Oryza brachyantha TaxID=4533 RepID=J3ND95_ORYBR
MRLGRTPIPLFLFFAFAFILESALFSQSGGLFLLLLVLGVIRVWLDGGKNLPWWHKTSHATASIRGTNRGEHHQLWVDLHFHQDSTMLGLLVGRLRRWHLNIM